jgi:hypothetical protein
MIVMRLSLHCLQKLSLTKFPCQYVIFLFAVEDQSLPTRILSWDEFPESLKTFMKVNDIPSDAYDIKVLSRFVR